MPTVVEYMEPFFQRTAEVESLVSEEVHKADKQRIEETLEKAKEIAKKMADGSAPIIKTLGDAVVGGSSQAVGSPTNCGRIAHELLNEGEKVTEITIELYPELFARRTINVPGVLMGAVYGCSTSDYKTYEVAVERVKADGVKVNIVRGEEYQIQKVTLVTDKGNSVMVDTLNRGGGRLVLRNATPSLEKAQEAAKKLGIAPEDMGKCVVLEDTFVGLEAGAASGATTIAQTCTIRTDTSSGPQFASINGYDGIDAAALDGFVRQRLAQ